MAGIAITTAGKRRGRDRNAGTTGDRDGGNRGQHEGWAGGEHNGWTVIVATIVARRIRSLAAVRTTGATTAGISRRPATTTPTSGTQPGNGTHNWVTAGISRRPAHAADHARERQLQPGTGTHNWGNGGGAHAAAVEHHADDRHAARHRLRNWGGFRTQPASSTATAPAAPRPTFHPTASTHTTQHTSGGS